MKIAFIFMSMPVGGAEDFALAMAANFPPGFETVFVCLRDWGILGNELLAGKKNIVLLEAAPSKRWNLPGVIRLARWLRKQEIDIVHSQTYHAHTYAIPAARLAGCRSVLHQQKTLENLAWRRFHTLRWMARMADRVLVLSDKTRRDFVDRLRLPVGKIDVLPNAVDSKIFFPAKLEKKDRPIIGAIASLNDVKNHDATLEMATIQQNDGIDFELVIVGEGRSRQHLQEKIANLELLARATLVGNQRPIAPWLQSFTVLVMPSHWEGQPMVLLQALACEIPVVASAIEGNIAALGKNHPGLFAPGQIEEYATKVRRTLQDSAFREEILAFQTQHPPPFADEIARSLSRVYDLVVSQ